MLPRGATHTLGNASAAHGRGDRVDLSEWVRQALREAERKTSSGDVEAKLVAIRKGRELRESRG
jgi:hypothetical protein